MDDKLKKVYYENFCKHSGQKIKHLFEKIIKQIILPMQKTWNPNIDDDKTFSIYPKAYFDLFS